MEILPSTQNEPSTALASHVASQGGDHAKIADFGIATALGSTNRDAIVTRSIGTPAYMAPEQKIRGAKVGPWTDVFALAATLWEFITSDQPGSSTNKIADAATLSALAVLELGLAPDWDRRPKDTRAFGSLLGSALQTAH